QPNSFTSADCEFLRQLSEHVALAAQQAVIYAALQRAYDDLRQTQQAVQEQERLRALGQMASGIAHDLHNAVPPAAVYPEAELAPDLPALSGIESEVREALVNLIFNAVDAMPDGGTLKLRTEVAPNAQGVRVEVADTGVGMDEETRRRCLEPFFTTKGERGTGLGLAMAYGMTQRHGADIEIESAVGRGTTVRLRFPVPTAKPAASAVTAPPEVPT